jgi:hypothetical protein
MKDNFDNQIKDLLEGSQPDGAGLGLDKNALWNRIEQKQKSNIIPFKKWASHAAAAIIGIMVCLPFLFHNNKTIVTKTITRLQPANTKVITDTIFLKNTPALASTKAAPFKSKTLQPPTGKAVSILPQPVVTIHLPAHDTAVSMVQPTMVAQATTGHTRIKALHLKDMGNENATHQFLPTDKPNFIQRLASREEIQVPTESISAFIGQQFFTSNN